MADSPQRSTPRGRRRWTWKRIAAWAGCFLLGGAIAGELGARYIIGLGDPPLFLLDPDMEYVLKPNQRVRRFGHDFIVNRWSMRSEDFPEHKPAAQSDQGELRVMVIGDSIVNGGGRIDHRELATSVLQQRLGESMHRRVVVGNISAASWGPPNELAYVRRFGLFDADVVVIVLNTGDECDVPGLEYIGSAWPRHKPVLALQELLLVYGWRKASEVLHVRFEPPPPAHTTTHEQDVETCRKAFLELVELARSKGARVALVQYLRRVELDDLRQGRPHPAGYETIRNWAAEAHVPAFSCEKAFQEDLAAGHNPFLEDAIHLSPGGQALLERTVEEAVGAARASE